MSSQPTPRTMKGTMKQMELNNENFVKEANASLAKDQLLKCLRQFLCERCNTVYHALDLCVLAQGGRLT